MSPLAPAAPARRGPPVARRSAVDPPAPFRPLPAGDGPRRRYRMTREDYVAFQEAQTDAKFEWVRGEAIEMAGATEEHCDVTGNLDFLLRLAMRVRRTGKVYNSDMRVRTGAGPARYPDVAVVLGRPRFAPHPEGKRLDLLNPAVVVEVLSERTGDTDETDKLAEYAATPSVTDYVIADSRSMSVVHRTRADAGGPWREATLTDPADTLDLPALGFAATLAEIYDGVELPAAAAS